MLHKDVFQQFKEIYPISDEAIDKWFPIAKNSIRVCLTDHRQLIFTFHSEDEWKLETFIAHMKSLMETKNERKKRTTENRKNKK